MAALVPSPIPSDSPTLLGRAIDELDLVVLEGPPHDRISWEVPIIYRGSNDDGFWDYLFSAGGPRVRARITDAGGIDAPVHGDPGVNRAIDRLVDSAPTRYHRSLTVEDTVWNQVFLATHRGEVLAGEYERGEGAIAWVLPEHANIVEWFRLFLQRLHELRSDLVPKPPPNWEPWDTAETLVLRRERDEAYREFDALAREYSGRISAIDNAIEGVLEASDRGLGRLITDDGPGLQEAVADAFTRLGFEVEDVDASLASGKGKREDLRVRRADEVAIVEVKGYTKGAKTTEFTYAAGYAGIYEVTEGQPPDRQWNVVNHFRSDVPNDRPDLFAGQEDTINAYPVLAIDTRHLFQLVRDVELGAVSPEEAQRILWDTPRGFWAYPPK